MINRDLKELYDQIYRAGPENFHTMTTEDVTAEVIRELVWSGKRVLEIGCGQGFTAGQISRNGGTVLACDYSQEAIDQARATFDGIETLTFVTSPPHIERVYPFDVVVAQELLEHTDDPQKALADWSAYLIPGGTMIITCPSFLNVRGYIWMTLAVLLDVPMSLSDLHFVAPWDIERWSASVGLELESWRTFRFDLAHGEAFMKGMTKRLTNALRDAGLEAPGPVSKEDRIKALLTWMHRAARVSKPSEFDGAGALYRLRKVE